MSKAYLDVRVLNAAAMFASTEQTRYYLCGVAITGTPGDDQSRHAFIVATDGHRLLAHKATPEHGYEGDLDGEYIIPSDILKQIKVTKKSADIIEFEALDTGECTLTYEGVTLSFRPIDGTYPDWHRIIPGDTSGEIAQFNADYLASFQKAQKALGETSPGLYVKHNGSSAALIPFQHPNTVGVIMPCLTNDAPIIPFWQ